MENKKLIEVPLISEELFKLYSNASRNVGVDKIIPYINLAQPFYIVPILGYPLFEELQEQVKENTLTDDNKALILKIAAPLALYTDYLAIRGLAYTITQKGITKEDSENSTPITEKELGEYKKDVLNQAEMAKELLVAYLCRCQHLYPKWQPQEPCKCNKYTEEKEGSTEVTKKYQIYFPKQKKGCACK